MIYHEKHLVDPFHHSKKVNLGLNRPGCGISDSVQSWMDQIQHNGEKDSIDSKGEEHKDSNFESNNDKNEETEEDVLEPIHFNTENVGPAYKYSAEGNSIHRYFFRMFYLNLLSITLGTLGKILEKVHLLEIGIRNSQFIRLDNLLKVMPPATLLFLQIFT